MTQASLQLQVPEGVHLRMPLHIFEDSRAIGPADLRKLYWEPANWWAASEHNRYRKPPPRNSRRQANHLDTALCALVLEGEDAYLDRFAIEPDDGSPRYAYTRDQVRSLLKSKGVEIPRGDFTDATLHRLVRKHGLAHKVFSIARSEYEAARKAGRGHITDDEDRRLRQTARVMLGHKDVGAALTGGLSEVSVFWRREDDPDTLLRARFHKIRRRRTFTITPIRNWKGRDVADAVSHEIADSDLEIERRLGAEAFEELEKFVSAGRIHAWDVAGRGAEVLQDERDTLADIVSAGEPVWWWIFVQLPSDEIGKERALVVEPKFHMPAGKIWDIGGEKIEAALGSFRAFRSSFTLDRQWVLVGEGSELTDDDVRIRQKRENA